MQLLSPLRTVTVGAAAGALVLSGLVAADASAHPVRHRLAGSTPSWVRVAQPVADVPDASRIPFAVLLKMRAPAEAARLVDAISTPGTPLFGKHLTPAQFKARFAPTAAQASAVKDWLTAQGFRVTNTFASGGVVQATGSARQIEKTFSTTLKNYRFQGALARSNDSDLSLATDTPAEVTSAITGVVGIDQGSALKKPSATLPGPQAGYRTGEPCSDYFGQRRATGLPRAYGKVWSYAVCGYTPQQVQSAYGLTPLHRAGITGRGITVAVTGAFVSPTLVEDVRRYNEVHRLPQFRPGQFTQIVPGPDEFQYINECGGNGWYGETTMDVEAVHAMAPGADVVYIGATDCGPGLDMAWAQAIDNHTADIITNSWGTGIEDIRLLGQDYVNFYQHFATQAALTGISVLYATGDRGDHTRGGTDLAAKTAEFPATLPFVTAVGGTSVAINRGGRRVGEWGWQNGYSPLDPSTNAWTPQPPGIYSGGGGGGVSQIFAQPAYQARVVPNRIATYQGRLNRVVPDVSMLGDPNTGFLVGQTQTFPDGTYWSQYRSGGTSLSSPLMAGVLAVTGQLAHRPIGFANPVLYRAARIGAIRDIVAPRSPVAQVRTNYVNNLDPSAGRAYILATIDVQTSTLRSTRGFDDETGLGSPQGPAFFVVTALLSRLPRPPAS